MAFSRGADLPDLFAPVASSAASPEPSPKSTATRVFDRGVAIMRRPRCKHGVPKANECRDCRAYACRSCGTPNDFTHLGPDGCCGACARDLAEDLL